MDKVIIHPGDGWTLPTKGDYVKIHLMITDNKGIIWFDSHNTKNKFWEVRFKTKESNMFEQLEELLGEMSLYEKCALEIASTYESEIRSKQVKLLLSQYNKIIYTIEIVNISHAPFFS